MGSSDGDDGLSMLSLLLTIGSLCCTILGCVLGCIKCSSKRANSTNDDDDATRDSLRASLVSHVERNTHVDASFRHAAEGSNKCAFCGFENLRRFLFCRLCTKPIVHEDIKGNSSTTANTSSQTTSSSTSDKVQIEKTSVNEERAPSRAVERRQRARLRRQWVRKVDTNGELYWYKEAVAKCSSRYDSSVTAGPEFNKGYVPFFTVRPITVDNDKELGESKTQGKQAITDGQPPSLTKASLVDALNKSAASVQLELVDTTKANPAQLPIHDDDSSVQDDNDDDDHAVVEAEPETRRDNQARDILRETLAIASNGFLTKFSHFAQVAEELATSVEDQLVRITVSRDDAQVLDDSMELLAVIPRDSVRCTFDVHFTNVVGHNGHAHEYYDEWFDLFDDALADLASGVFRPVDSGLKQNLYLNPDSLHDIGDHHLLYYFATGRFIGRAMLAGYTLSFHLALPLLKMMLGLPLSLGDVEYVDREGYKRIVDVLSVSEDSDDDDNALEKLELHFSVMKQLADGGGYEMVDLISDGRHVAVTHDNKLEYVERVFRYALFENVSGQLHAFLSGFYEVMPRKLLLLFDPEELDYVLCESHEINIVESKKTRRFKKTTKKVSKRRKRKSSSSSDGIAEMLVEGGAISLEIALEIG